MHSTTHVYMCTYSEGIKWFNCTHMLSFPNCLLNPVLCFLEAATRYVVHGRLWKAGERLSVLPYRKWCPPMCVDVWGQLVDLME